MPRHLITIGTTAAAFFGAWLLLGQLGYRSGSRVTLGPAAVDPELIRGLLAALAALLGGAAAKWPWLDAVRSFLTSLGLASSLSPDEQRELYDRVKRIDETIAPISKR